MRVLYLSPSGELGGAERALLENISALRSQEPSWTIGLIALEDGPALSEARSLGIDVTVLPPPPLFAATGESGHPPSTTLLRLTRSAAPLVGYARTLRREVAAWRPDVVHSNGIKTHVLGAWAKASASLVWHVHDYLSTRHISAPLLRHHRRSVAAVIANSNSVAADVRRVLGDHVRTATIYNAVDPERFTPEGPRMDLDAAAGLPHAAPGTLRIGLVGTFARWKGHEVFLRALAGMPDRHSFRAYVVGGPVYRTGDASQVTIAELRAIVRETGLDGLVGFTGFVARPAEAYRALDVVVHASTEPEPFGLAIAEAMACGRPVILSEAGGAMEIGESERTCLTHLPGDVGRLTRQIARLLHDAPLRERLAGAGAAFVRERFTRARLAQSLGHLYHDLTNASCQA
jgi:glycosyltransferase involved in cell wall biosynthesis